MRLVRGRANSNPPVNLQPHRRASLGEVNERRRVTLRGDIMSFFIAAILGGFSGVLYLAGERQAFTSVCRYTFRSVPAPELAALSCGCVSDTRDAVPAAEDVRITLRRKSIVSCDLQQIRRDDRPPPVGCVVARAIENLAPLRFVEAFEQVTFDHDAADVEGAAPSALNSPSIKSRRAHNPCGCVADWTLHDSPGVSQPESALKRKDFPLR